jgi:hypothetical protein
MGEVGVVVVERVRDRPVGERRCPRRNLRAEPDDRGRRFAAVLGDETTQDALDCLVAADEFSGEPVEQREARHRPGAGRDLRGGGRRKVEQTV